MSRGFLFMLFAACAGTALAQPVYRWTDAEGRLQFGDRPPPGADARAVEIAPPPADAGLAPAAVHGAVAVAGLETRAAQRQSLSIVMYSTANCGYCARARRFFAQRGIGYREKDIDRYAQAKAEWKRLGGAGVPLFVINGEVSRGFNAEAMARRLERLGW